MTAFQAFLLGMAVTYALAILTALLTLSVVAFFGDDDDPWSPAHPSGWDDVDRELAEMIYVDGSGE